MINKLFNHIKKHKLVYGIGALALVVVVVVFALTGNGVNYASKLSGNIQWAGASITEEQFGQEMAKAIGEYIEKTGPEKWDAMKDIEREKIIDEIFAGLRTKYGLSEKKEMKSAAKEKQEKERLEKNRESSSSSSGGGGGEEWQKNVQVSQEVINEMKSREPKTVDPSLLKPVPCNGGKIVINQIDGFGTVVLEGPNSLIVTVTATPYTNNCAETGKYTLTVTPPANTELAGVFVGTTKVAKPYKQTLAKGGTITYDVKYKASPTGTVNISTNHASGLYTIHKKSGGSYVDTGGGTLSKQFTLEAGTAGTDYTVLFGTVTGYTTPAVVNFNLVTGDTKTFVGNYTPMSVSTASLTAAKTSNIISQQYVKGSKSVDALQVALTAGNSDDITVKQLTFRIYGDDDGNFDGSGLGDVEAKTYVTSAQLYEGKTLIAGPESLTLVDNGDGKYTIGVDYDKIVFSNLSLKINKGSTKSLTVQLDLGNSSTIAVAYIATDIDPDNDVVAEDGNANQAKVTPVTGLNLSAMPNPMVTVVQNGKLSAVSSSGSIVGGSVAGGKTDLLVSQYTFAAEKEAYAINKLTIINEADPKNGFDTPVKTNAVNSVKITYPDNNGVLQSATGYLTGGMATLTGLKFYVPKDNVATLKVYADVSSSPFVAGQKFTIGLKEGAGNTNKTFEAVGESSGVYEYFNTPGDVKNYINISTFTVATKGTLSASQGTQSSSAMPSSDGDLYKFYLKATGGDAAFTELVFDVTATDLASKGTEDIFDWSIRNSAGQISGCSITGEGKQASNNATVSLAYGANGTGLKNANTTKPGVDDGLYRVTVKCSSLQIVADGMTEAYTLRASIIGATMDDQLEVGLNKTENTGINNVGGLTPFKFTK